MKENITYSIKKENGEVLISGIESLQDVYNYIKDELSENENNIIVSSIGEIKGCIYFMNVVNEVWGYNNLPLYSLNQIM